MTCPLCRSTDINHYYRDQPTRNTEKVLRDYFQCSHCQLVFVPPEQWPSAEREKAEYDLHENDSDDAGYRRFLDHVLVPIMEHIPDNAHGLDFGCGPGPTISIMMQERGYRMDNFDIFYANEPEVLQRSYDFVTCTEVVEHLQQPWDVINQLVKCVKTDGVLGIMTKRVIDPKAFATWHYKNDITHIIFFSDQTFAWLAQELDLELTIVSNDTVLLHKSSGNSQVESTV